MSERQSEKKRQLPAWQESILLIAVAMVMAIVVKTFFLQAFYIPSESMEPEMLPDDKLLVQKVSYWAGDVKRGDIVVFDDPGGWLDMPQSQATNPVQKALEKIGLFPTGGHLIKRVVGIGGDTVKCCSENGQLTVNGTAVDEPYLLDQQATRDKAFEIEVPQGYLWVMGDNRANSADSRAHLGDPGGGYIDQDSVVGKAWLRVWPLGRAGFIEGVDSFDSVAARPESAANIP